MNGAHDVGGMQSFGKLPLEENEPIFHADWERRVLGLTLAAGALGHWNIDESRFTREGLHPAIYYGSSYYQIWLLALEQLLAKHGLLKPEEIQAGKILESQSQLNEHALKAEKVDEVLAKGAPVDRPTGGKEPGFAEGQEVCTRILNPRTHTRLPRYARGKRGKIVAIRGYHIFPDQSAHGDRSAAQWLYGVSFTGQELWGDKAERGLNVCLDAWESYLEPA
jgi:nitrile hydratase beta subunit